MPTPKKKKDALDLSRGEMRIAEVDGRIGIVFFIPPQLAWEIGTKLGFISLKADPFCATKSGVPLSTKAQAIIRKMKRKMIAHKKKMGL